MVTENVGRSKWFPYLAAGLPYPSQRHAKTLVTVAWLLMAEGFAYMEDVDGAENSPALLEVLRIRIAEFFYEIESQLNGTDSVSEVHHLALLFEYGLAHVRDLSGLETIELLGVLDESRGKEDIQELNRIWHELVSDFPGGIPNPLLPENQGVVLRLLRNWSKVCEQVGLDAAFLAPLMKAV